MSVLDRFFERLARQLARREGRRSFLARAGAVLVGASAAPLLPISRAAASSHATRVPAPDESIDGPEGDPKRC